MKLINEIVKTQKEFASIRQKIHKNPELGFHEVATAKLVAGLLGEYGYQVHEKVGRTGVVAVLKKGNGNKKIGLRADMDALPMQELAEVPYKSEIPGVMHACGHDGHTASLLMAAKYLSKCDFNGQLNLIFQPAEEGSGGALSMINDGLFERFDCDYIFSWHNLPCKKQDKQIFFKKGVFLSSSDRFKIKITGSGGHASAPQNSKDPTLAACHLILALQSIVSRNTDPQQSVVISVGSIIAGNDESYNIIPEQVEILLSVRTLNKNVRKQTIKRINEIIEHCSNLFGLTSEVEYYDKADVTYNDEEATSLAWKIAGEIFGNECCAFEHSPGMASDDLSYMLSARKGCYAYINNGDTAYVHNGHYVFNDDLLSIAATYFAKITLEYLQ
ncbi:amidohydrolase [Salmonella enterica]|uniref:Amidohydrolase n=1 Tax=Salmonella enterica TaxID=28901 RepID=A0A627EYM5_SALER|nr:M20 aminoacylase family protein [Salmonella enterica]EBR9314623.1 amidohydrolase [Salmonella enterica subsp. enterica serovar Muenchen]EBV3721198.1 amidohydrolase [Salmonella enterica subsp. enterica serovar Oranienburg]EDU2592229.1 amidohydrolase [Salmonella enterica subsp. enterica serovar Sandiego]EDX3512070.1 amidohydrolase [Salmonella enterica subsp. enterica serovar Adelaide]EEG7923122.1 amidohydrolase [Salmonella enterica subsp. enterica serovar Newport]EHA8878820.1 amidohydrolase [